MGTWCDEYHGETGGQRYSIFRCGACDAVCYETVSWDSTDFNIDHQGNPYTPEHSVQYPAPVSAQFDFNTEATPYELNEILEEMLYSLAGSKLILATIGLRLAIEFIVNDRNCAGKNLKTKIDDLKTQNAIDDDQMDLLHRIRIKGNEGAHKAQGMSVNELISGMGIIEGLLERLYNGPARHEATIKKAKQYLKDNK